MLDWQNIDTVMLDMDGTLLDLHFDTYYWLHHLPQRYADIKGVSLTQAKDVIYPKLTAQKGTLNWYCLDYWQQEFDIDIVALKKEIDHKVQLLPGTEDFLNWLTTTNKRIFLVTNAHSGSLAVKQPHARLERWLHGIYLSHDYGYAKEEQGFWAALQEDIGYDAERSLMVDDNLQVLGAAQESGIGHLLAVSEPDSQRPAQHTGDFNSVAHLGLAIPATETSIW
ncbi:MAG: GMP/IMP nucleotidase [Gammaproteobacteria bacterium]|nr:GMP/IMP nucleotidase [Gammaproteobacteria bacterium]